MLARMVENIQRYALTEADEAEAYHQLSLIGVSAAQIAKKTGRTKITVKDALKAKSTTAGDAALGRSCTIEKALILAELKGTRRPRMNWSPCLRTKPTSFCTSRSFCATAGPAPPHAQALVAELEATGTAIVEDVGYYAEDENLYVSSAKRADGEPATDEDANAYKISTDYRGHHTANSVITGWKDLGSPRSTNATKAAHRPRKAR